MTLTMGMLAQKRGPISLAATATSVSSSTTPSISLPSGIVAGNIILIFASIDTSSSTITTPSGFTQIATNTTPDKMYIWAKVATGSEGTSISTTASIARDQGYVSYRISNAYGTIDSTGIAVSTVVVASSGTTVNPASLTPSWGSANNLWIATCNMDGGDRDVTAYPTNYTLGQVTSGNTAGPTSTDVAACARILTASTEDPGAFTFVRNGAFAAYTLAVRPA